MVLAQALPMPLCGVSVCPSATFVYSVETNKPIFKTFSPLGSHTTLVIPYQTLWQFSDGDHPIGGVECRWGRQTLRFSTNIWLRHQSLLDRHVSSTFWQCSKVTALRGGGSLSRETNDETPCISESCLWQEVSTLRRRNGGCLSQKTNDEMACISESCLWQEVSTLWQTEQSGIQLYARVNLKPK